VVSRQGGFQTFESQCCNHTEIYVETLEEALKLRPQAAILANPSSMHVEVALRLAREGIHLFIEKPLSNTRLGISELFTICRLRKICLHIGYNLRFLPTLQFFRSQLHNGKIGKILSVRCEVGQYLPTWRPQQDYQDAVSAQKKLGGGVLLELSHEIDYLRWIFGEVTEVTAVVDKLSSLEIDVEDTAMLLLKSKLEKLGEDIFISLNMDCIRHDVTRNCLAIGDKGTLLWDGVSGIVAVYDIDEGEWQPLYKDKPERDLTYILEIQNFIKCIAQHESSGPHASGEDAEKVLQIIEAAKHSAMQQRTIAITPGKQNE
jgi:predicted dehydrogenase